MKSLLFVIPTMRMGGAERSLVSLLNALDPTRVKVDLLLFEGGGELQSQLPSWVNVIEADPITRGMVLEIRFYLKDLAKRSIPATISRIWMTARADLGRKLKLTPKFNWDIIKNHIPPLQKQYDVAIGFLEGFTDYYVIDKVSASRKIGWIHTDISKLPHTREEDLYYSKFDMLATITDSCRSSIVDRYPCLSEKTYVVQNIVSEAEILRKAAEPMSLSPSNGLYELVTVARLEYIKGIDIAIEACRILSERHVPICWHIYGDGSLRKQLDTQIKTYGLSEMLILHGTVPNPYPFIKASDLVVQPSRLEGKSVVLDEAKLLGKAIVVTNYPSVSDQIQHGKTGWIVEITPEAIAEGIEHVLNNPDLRSNLEKGCLNLQDETPEVLNTFYQMIG